MRLYVNLGAEERAVEFASKAACRKSLRNARRVNKYASQNNGDLEYRWKGRPYSGNELVNAEILTTKEHWEALNKGLR